MDDGGDIRVTRFEVGASELRPGLVHRKRIPFAIVVQPLEGAYVVTGPERSLRIKTGEVALVAAHLPVAFAHHGGAAGRMTARWLHVQALYRDTIDPCALFITPCRIAGAAAAAIGAAFVEFAARGPTTVPGQLARTALAYRILAIALESAPPHPRARELLAASARLGPLSAWLHEHLHRPLTIDHIARQASVSRSRLHALFQAHLGRAPMAHLKEIRLAAGARLLLTTSDSVAHIAAAIGFANPFHFSREFAHRYGLPPSAYRDEQRLSFGR